MEATHSHVSQVSHWSPDQALGVSVLWFVFTVPKTSISVYFLVPGSFRRPSGTEVKGFEPPRPLRKPSGIILHPPLVYSPISYFLFLDFYIYISGGSRISRRGRRPRTGGGVDSRGSYVSKILCVKMKESGPLGACTGHAP